MRAFLVDSPFFDWFNGRVIVMLRENTLCRTFAQTQLDKLVCGLLANYLWPTRLYVR